MKPSPEAFAKAPNVQPARPRSRLRRWTVRLLRIGVGVYLGLALLIYAMQKSLVFPGMATQGKAESIVKTTSPDQQLLRLSTADGEQIAALFGPALSAQGQPLPGAAARPTLIFFYGNAMCLNATWDLFFQFRRLGFNVMIPEFVGYGMSTGSPSQAGVYATADAAYEHLLSRRDIDPRRIVVSGWSLGSAAAFHLAATRPVAGLAAFSAFTSMVDMAHHLFPFLPTSLLLKDKLENAGRMPSIRCPIFLAHGTRDSLVPFRMNAQLSAAARVPCATVAVEGGDHNDIFDVGGPPLMSRLAQFVDSLK